MKNRNNKNYRNNGNNFRKGSLRQLPIPQMTEIHVIGEDYIKVPREEYKRLIASDYGMDIFRGLLATKKYPDGDMLRAIAGVVLLEDKHE